LQLNPRYSIAAAGMLILCCYITAQWLFNFHHRWFPFLMPQACIAAAIPLSLAYQFLRERFQRSEAVAQRAQMMGLFSRYVTPEVANEIWNRRDEVVLAGEERIATVLFSDIRGFTALSAGKPSRTVLAWLNSYFTAMDEVITAEGGFLNKFIGDGLMVLFGVPLGHGVEEDATRAVRTALRMLEKVQELNQKRPSNSDFPLLHIGIGIHTGPLTSGNIGSLKRLEYSAIGDSVNLASRCESLTKEFRTDIILTEATYGHVADRFSGFRDLGMVAVRGFEKQVRLYTIERLVQQPPGIAVPVTGVEDEDQSS
jgi:adenylate cyclase